MDDSTMTETARISIAGMRCGQCIEKVRAALEKLEGVEELDVSMGAVTLTYYPMAVSLDRITACITALGYSAARSTPSRNPFRRFLDGMIRANEEAFGSQPPSCCGAKKA
jgi:copper chaperone CopZ